MKKLLIFSFTLLAFILFGSLGCEKYRSSRIAGPVEPDVTKMYFLEQTYKPMIAAPVRAEPAIMERPALVKPKPLFISESGQLIISRIYPAPEFAIVQMDKTMPAEVELSKSFDYSISLKNLTNETLTNIVITEELPDNFKYIGSEPSVKENENNLVWKIESLGPRDCRQITVSGFAKDANSIRVSTTVVTHFFPASADIKVIQPRLELAVAVPAGAILCDNIPFKIVVTNSGTGTARNVRIVNTLPTGLLTTEGKSELLFDAGNLSEGQSRQFSTYLRAIKTGKYVGKTVATATDLKSKSQENTIVVGKPVLTISKTGTEQQYAGKVVTYAITVTNKGDAPAKDIIVEDTIPRGVTSIKATAGAKLTSSRKVLWRLGTLAPDASQKVRVSYVPTQVGTLINKTTAIAYCAEVVTASAETSVTGISGVLLEVVDDEDPIEIGTNATYIIRVVNQGSAPATGISIVCGLEGNVRYVSSTGATTGLVEGNMITFALLDSLAPKTKATWRVVVQALEPADTRFKVTMNADQLTRPVEETEATHLYK